MYVDPITATALAIRAIELATELLKKINTGVPVTKEEVDKAFADAKNAYDNWVVATTKAPAAPDIVAPDAGDEKPA